MIKWIASITAACCVAAATTSSAHARTMTLDDLKLLAGISEPAISPDGTAIAFIVSHPNYKTDQNDRDLMLIDVATGAQRRLTFERKGVGSPQWSPDGNRLGFLARSGEGKDAQEQLFSMDMRGGDPQRITSAPLGVEQFKWSPDGMTIAYVTPDEPVNKKLIEKHHDWFIQGDQDYLSTSAPTSNHIWLVHADGSATKRLTAGTWSLPTSQPPGSPASPLSWSPDGRWIAFAKMPNAFDADGDLAVVAAVHTQSGSVRAITSHGKFEGYGDFSPDGTKLAYWYPFNGDGAAQNDIFVTSATGGDGTDITATEIDSNVQRAIWMPDSKSLLIAGHKDTDAALWIKPLQGAARRIALGTVQPVQSFWLDASVSKTGAIAFAGSEPHHPVEIYYMASTQAVPKRLTSYNDAVAALDLGSVQSIEWTGEHGFREDGVLTYPPGYVAGKQYPLVLNIHGGPNSASIASFNAFSQLMAAHGWIVFSPNYRGSDNLGEAYWHAIVGDSGDGPGKDVIAGVGAVHKLGIEDPSRIAVSGWSYGGYMTSWLIGHYHIWKTAVSGAAVNNLVDEYALADNGVQWRYQFGGSPWSGKSTMQAYMEQSPITYAGAITTPTLILSDTGDARVPITQSYEMYRALRERGVSTQFYAYPVAGHFPGDPVRAMDVDRRWIEWLARYLR